MAVVTLLLLLLSWTSLIHDLVDAEGEFFSKLTQPLSLKVMVIETNSAGSRVECSWLCSLNPKCRFFAWNKEDRSCVTYRPTIRGDVGETLSDLYVKQGSAQCPLNRHMNDQGRCICANGRYGQLCEKEFKHELKLQQLFPSNYSINAEHIEVDGVSYLIQVSKENGSPANISGFFSIHARDARVSTTYQHVVTSPTNSTARSVSAFSYDGVDYFMITGGSSVPFNSSYTYQLLYSYDVASKQFVERSRFNLAGAVRSSFFQHSNGDLYMCLAILVGTRSPFIYTPLQKVYVLLSADSICAN